MAVDPDKLPTVWMRSIQYHTYEGQPQPEGAYYLAHESMVETIEAVLKFAVRDTAPRKAVRPVEAVPVTPAPAAPTVKPMTTESWLTPSSTTTRNRPTR